MVVVLSYWDVSSPSFGGGRRVDALLNVLGRRLVLVQPVHHHPRYATVPFPIDLGRRKIGINWGIFNFRIPRNARIVRGVIRAQSPQLIVLTSIWNRFPLRGFPDVPKVLDSHDVNAVAIGERFGPNHPFTRMVRAQEAKTLAAVDHVFACSEGDRERFIADYRLPAAKVSVTPNGVQTSKFTGAGRVRHEDPLWRDRLADSTVLFFMGKLDYQPNVAGLEFLAETLMPDLEKRAPGKFKLLVTGGPVPDHVAHPSIVFAGRVPDETLTAYLQSVDLCLAPVFSGSGTRLKILEYMAAARPVISTPKGAEGIHAEPGRDLAIREADAFADEVMRLAGREEERSAIGQAGRRFVEQHFDWETSIAPRWRGILERWIDFS